MESGYSVKTFKWCCLVIYISKLWLQGDFVYTRILCKQSNTTTYGHPLLLHSLAASAHELLSLGIDLEMSSNTTQVGEIVLQAVSCCYNHKERYIPGAVACCWLASQMPCRLRRQGVLQRKQMTCRSEGRV